ncbi:MAG: endolytic transglycosylase MltG [Bacteroidia bacterium]
MDQSNRKFWLWFGALGLFLGVCFGLYWFVNYSYWEVYRPSIVQSSQYGYRYLNIPTGSDFKSVVRMLRTEGMITDTNTFKWLAEDIGYRSNVFPGRYKISKGISEEELVELLRSGMQEPVKLRMYGMLDKTDLAKFFAEKLEADSTELLALLDDEEFLADYGLTPESVMSIFLGGKHELYWNSDARKVFRYFYGRYREFWTPERLEQAGKLDMTPFEVTVLASIVQEESYRQDELACIAGVYCNRLEKGMKLQADPTLKYLLRYHDAKRIYYRNFKIESPYNTYMHKGLPPGPISIPSQPAINAVLNREEHNYLFFCARADFSGYHNFAVTYEQHAANADLYHAALDENNIE